MAASTCAALTRCTPSSEEGRRRTSVRRWIGILALPAEKFPERGRDGLEGNAPTAEESAGPVGHVPRQHGVGGTRPSIDLVGPLVGLAKPCDGLRRRDPSREQGLGCFALE